MSDDEEQAVRFSDWRNVDVLSAMVNALTPRQVQSSRNAGAITQQVADAVERLRATGTVELPRGQDVAYDAPPPPPPPPRERFNLRVGDEEEEIDFGRPIVSIVPSDGIEAGADLRDGGGGIGVNTRLPTFEFEQTRALVSTPGPIGGAGPSGQLLPVLAVAAVLARMTPVVRVPIAAFFRGGYIRGAQIAWNSMPGWVRAALVAVGVTAGTTLVMDDIPIIDIGGGGGNGHPGPHLEHLGAHVIGGWTANGVQFYRLSDGKLAVQNKQGRWKVWKPKKPVVLMPGGASNLRTLLRADAILNKQSKKLAKMLNKRAPRARKSTKGGGSGTNIAMRSGTIVDV